MTSPTVSVIATSYNHEQYVEQCLDSIVDQTFRDFELVIMDDHSSDRSVERIIAWIERTGYPCTLIVNESNVGLCATRNIALGHCNGEFIVSASGDDWYEPRRLELQVRAFGSFPANVAVLYGNMRIVDEWGRGDRRWAGDSWLAEQGELLPRLIRGNCIGSQTAMIRRSALDICGPYDESLIAEDYDMWLRIASVPFEFRYLDELMTNSRELSTSLTRDSRNPRRLVEARVRALEKLAGRRPEHAAVVASRIWALGRRLLVSDPELAMVVLKTGYGIRDHARTRGVPPHRTVARAQAGARSRVLATRSRRKHQKRCLRSLRR